MRGSPAQRFRKRSPRASASGMVLHLDEGRAQHAPEARLLGRLRHLLLEVVHVHEGGGAGVDHLQGGQARGGLDEGGGDVARLRGEDVAGEPFHEAEVVRHPPEHDHGRMRVGVDEPGDHEPAVGVEHFAPPVGSLDLRPWPHGHDAAAVRGQRALRDHAAPGVHGHDRPVADDEVHRARGGAAHGREEHDQREEARPRSPSHRFRASKGSGSSSDRRTERERPPRSTTCTQMSPQYSQST